MTFFDTNCTSQYQHNYSFTGGFLYKYVNMASNYATCRFQFIKYTQAMDIN